MCNYYYGIIVRDSRGDNTSIHCIYTVNIGNDIENINTEKLQKFRSQWDSKFDWQLDPYEMKHVERLGMKNRKHGPVPVVTFVLKTSNDVNDVKEHGEINSERLRTIFKNGSLVELQRETPKRAVSFLKDSFRSVHEALLKTGR